MQQQITLELDTKIIELANKYASYKGKSMSDFDETETNWDELDRMVSPYRKGLSIDYKFDSELANAK